ncbi:MAG: metallophosphoesterase family protein [Pirellulaceae bacterium]|nr:metallophosphoesterase family protein [Pirellulaceae bacterium]
MHDTPVLERKLVATIRVVLCCMLFAVVTAAVATASTAHEYYGKPYLTWQGCPSTTMTINFHTQQLLESVAVVYGPKSDGETLEHRAEGVSRQIPGLADGRHVHSVELTGLEAGQTYCFRIELPEGLSPAYTFRTIPEGSEPLRFAIGGDALATPIFEGLVKHVAKQEPLFLVIGGDLAYANGNVKQIGRWDLWFAAWHKYGTTPEGRLIPLVMAIGNHETNGLEGTNEARAPFYFGFFPQGGKTFFSRQFGANLGMIVLDSGHVAKHETQVEFLEKHLKSFSQLPFRVAVYHVPLYPSHRPYGGKASAAGRTHWLPLFDAHGLAIGFEHHDHTFKRTKRLKNNELNPEGTLYVGDGSAGVVSRKPEKGRWYMEKTSSKSHVWIVDVRADEIHLAAMSRKGEIFDEATVEAAAVVVAE